MPKLSEDSLEKRFFCQYCGESMRTRQGLSGHIQFKHGPHKKKLSAADVATAIKFKLVIWQVCMKTINYPDEVSQAGNRVLHRWQILCNYFHLLGIDLDDKDFKHFMLNNFDY